MDSYQVATNIIAFSDFLGVVAKYVYGEKIELKTEIQGIRGESFDIDFWLGIAALTVQSATLLGAPLGFKEYFSLIKEAIGVWLHLKGSTPKQITPQSNNKIKIQNQDGSFIYANNSVINIITDTKGGKAAEQFISKPLNAGISQLSIKSSKLKDMAVIKKEEAPYFKQIGVETSLTDTIVEMRLQIQSLTFKEGNKWQFFDGQNTFYADIQDEKFLEKVNQRAELFGKGDTLFVKMRIKQSSTMNSLTIERTIVEVIRHVLPPKQSNFL